MAHGIKFERDCNDYREGWLVQVGEDIFFMKKYAKSRGCKLSPSEFLLLSWELAA